MAGQQMKLAALVAEARTAPPEPTGTTLALDIACVPGGVERLKAVEPVSLVSFIEDRLQWIAGHANEVAEPADAFYRLVVDVPTLRAFHAGTEALLRRVAEAHPDRPFRAVARRCLAIYLADLAHTPLLAESRRAYWVTRLGQDRVKQLARLEPKRLTQEAEQLADQLDKEFRDGAPVPDPRIEELRRYIRRLNVGRILPEGAQPSVDTAAALFPVGSDADIAQQGIRSS
jgi:hypothetical protein